MILDALEEKDAIMSYVDGVSGTVRKNQENKVLRAYLNGTPTHEILLLMHRCKPIITLSDIHLWLFGDEITFGFIGYMELCWKSSLKGDCPFCEARKFVRHSSIQPYPLFGKVCWWCLRKLEDT